MTRLDASAESISQQAAFPLTVPPLETSGCREALAASFAREAARRLADPAAAASPLDLAYAVRWLELHPSGPRRIAAWTDWLGSEPSRSRRARPRGPLVAGPRRTDGAASLAPALR